MNFSASELVKRSASQLIYLNINKQTTPVTKAQVKGTIYAHNLAVKEHASEERRITLKLGGNTIYACVDMVKDNKLIEVKSVLGTSYPDWYLHSSILQTAFFSELASKVKFLDTPAFRIKDGFKQVITTIPKDYTYELWFGKDKYIVNKSNKIYNHYIKKLKIVEEGIRTISFNAAREFDAKYKWREFNIYNPKFKKLR